MSPTEEKFLENIATEATLPPYVKPSDAAVATTSALFERLTSGEAHQVLTSLPPALQPLFEPCWARREGRPVTHLGRAELLDRVAWELGVAPSSAELISSAVFHALELELPRDVVDHVMHQLPHDLQELWSSTTESEEEVAGDLDLLRQLEQDIEKTGALPHRLTAREAFGTVMCLFTMRLSAGEARDLLLGLPRTVRPIVDRCILERRERPLTFGSDELVANVAEELGTDLGKAEAIALSVFAAVTRILPREVQEHVASQLPADLRALWSS